MAVKPGRRQAGSIEHFHSIVSYGTPEVYTVELYARVRRAVVVDKMSEREAARQFGLAIQ